MIRVFRSLTTLGALLLTITTAACTDGLTSPSGTTPPSTQASTTTSPQNGAASDGMTMTRWNFHLFCAMPASDPRVTQLLNPATGEHPRLTYSVDGGPEVSTNELNIQVPADAKSIKWSVIIADRSENPVRAYTLENQSTDTTPGSTVELVFNRPCGPGDPVPVAPTCSITNQSPIYAGDSVTVTGTGEPVPSYKAVGGVPSSGPASTSFQTKFDSPGDYVIISGNSEGGAKCPLTVLPRKVIDRTVFTCSASLPKVQVGQAVTFTATGNRTAGTKVWATDKDGSPFSWTGEKFTTSYSTPGTHKSTVKLGDEVAECQVEVEKRIIDPVACSVELTQKWVVPTYEQYTKGSVEWVATITPPDPGRSVTVSVDIDGAHSTTLTSTSDAVMSMPFEQSDNNAHTIVGSVSYRHSNGAQCANQTVLKLAPACILETTTLGNGVFKATNAGGSGICYGGGTHIVVKALSELANLKATVLTYGNGGQNKFHTSGDNACAGGECEVPVGDLGPNESGVIQTSSDKTTDATITSTFEGVEYRWGAFPWIGPFPIPVR